MRRTERKREAVAGGLEAETRRRGRRSDEYRRSVAWASPRPPPRPVYRIALFLTAEIYARRPGRPLFLPIGLIVRDDDRD